MNTKLALLLLAAAAPATASTAGPGLDWLHGHWCAGTDEERVEEWWVAPASGELLGLNRTTRKGTMSSFEYLRIVRQEGKVTYIAQPGGNPPTRFSLAEMGDQWAAFENPDHDFPQRIEYRRNGDKLQAIISGPGEGGGTLDIPFEFEACNLDN